MKHHIFRKYDIRGIVGKDFSIKETTSIARGIVTYLLEHNPALKMIAVAFDGRKDSQTICDNVVKVIQEAGIDVLFLGLCPTPTLSFALHTTSTTTGIMITASHNPHDYNGFKIFWNKKPVWGSQLLAIKEIIVNKAFFAAETKPGNLVQHDIISYYASWLNNKFPHLANLDLSMVIDCAHSCAGAIMPLMVDIMGWKNVTLLNTEIGLSPEKPQPDPTKAANIKKLIETIKKEKKVLGIAFDGDADRMTAVTEKGTLILGDQLLSLFSQLVLEQNPEASIVFDVKSSKTLPDVIKKAGGKPVMSPTGSSIIRSLMAEHGALLGGEVSCHFFFNDRAFGFDDGIYAGMRLIEFLQTTKQSLHEAVEKLPRTYRTEEIHIPHNKINYELLLKHVAPLLLKKGYVLIDIDGIRAEMPTGWGLLRSSNTEPYFTLRFEAATRRQLVQIIDDFTDALSTDFKKPFLKKYLQPTAMHV